MAPHRLMRSSLALTIDILETANRVSKHPIFEIDVASASDFIAEGAKHSVVILPGLGIASSTEFDELLRDPESHTLILLLKRLRAQDPKRLFATSCSGVVIFAEAGLTNKRKVTTSWWLAPLLKARYPEVNLSSRELIVDAGDILTAGAAFAQSDLMLNVVERFASKRTAHQCRRILLIDDRTSQFPYMDTAMLIASDPPFRLAETFVSRHISEDLNVSQLATAAKLGQRTFARRLALVTSLTPIQFLQRMRVDKAVQLAIQTRLSNEEIAVRVGYSDGSALRRVVRNHTGKTLEDHRRMDLKG
ncbi:GlxA family transcriptional regulator [uncultured Ruegeria sp.]|uniref:GlxA family transcriptional regulator n=1 Tax=uncultured Ruegeria sp. TaxID=259304 RepID=UPI00262A1608|nr:helix-turn-helix domain-containing protein [uncultured Ruegeria sp.]